MKSYIVRLSTKGQLTLPAGIRRKLGIGKGARLVVAFGWG
ncbi:MAG: AbrB/MazE/SpoVT family DNA-binding domain-containing protein [Bacillota bacterium]